MEEFTLLPVPTQSLILVDQGARIQSKIANAAIDEESTTVDNTIENLAAGGDVNEIYLMNKHPLPCRQNQPQCH